MSHVEPLAGSPLAAIRDAFTRGVRRVFFRSTSGHLFGLSLDHNTEVRGNVVTGVRLSTAAPPLMRLFDDPEQRIGHTVFQARAGDGRYILYGTGPRGGSDRWDTGPFRWPDSVTSPPPVPRRRR